MFRKTIFAILLFLLLLSMLTLAFNIQPVKAGGTIYIRADGSIEPGTTPISSLDNITYTFTGNIYDVIVVERTNIIIDGNGRMLQGTGIGYGFNLTSVSNVTIKSVNIHGFERGVFTFFSSYNTISGNNITGNGDCGIQITFSSFHNIIFGNNITNNHDGIWIESDSNDISRNNIKNNDFIGIHVKSNNNKVFKNRLTNNMHGIFIGASNNYIAENTISQSSSDGIQLSQGASSNTFVGNTIINNYVGIIFDRASNNVIYHNNFIDNIQYQVWDPWMQYPQIPPSLNIWDNGYPSGGNYWSNYVGVDLYSGSYQYETESDGVGDTPYVIYADNQDRYPLMAPFSTFNAGTWNGIAYNVDIVSNSTLSDFYFSPDEGSFLKFNVTGDYGTAGFCRITIPKSLLWAEDGWTVHVGEESVNYKIIPDENYTYLYFTYNHSTKIVEIRGTHVIPEFPSAIIMPFLMILTMLAVVFANRKIPRRGRKDRC